MSDTEKLVVDARQGQGPRPNYGTVSSNSAENGAAPQVAPQVSESRYTPEGQSDDSESRRVNSPSNYPTTTSDETKQSKTTEDTNVRNTTYVTLAALTLNWLKLCIRNCSRLCHQERKFTYKQIQPLKRLFQIILSKQGCRLVRFRKRFAEIYVIIDFKMYVSN